jgi:CubicO group peptidase (beta-lactamase class C family)
MKKLNHIFSLLFLAHTCLAQGNFIKDSLDNYIKREMQRWQLPGMALAIVKDGKVIFMKGYGVSDINKKTAVTENTVFQIASCSKAFTGTSLALLEHYGKLKLDDKVKKYLPYFKMSEDWRTEQVTIRDVLSHRIGFATFQSDLLNWNTVKPRKELIVNMVNIDPKYGFREKYGYCNLGFLTAGEIIPAVCDTTWDDYLKYHYFIPLDMKNTHTRYSEFISDPNASKPYTLVENKITELTAANVDNLGPAGSVVSTVNDMSHWILMQLANGKYNGKQVVPQMVIGRTRQSNTIVSENSGLETYGLGWFLKENNCKKVVEHDGGANGFLSKTVLIPSERSGFVILTNSDAQYFFEALGRILTDDLTGAKFTDYNSLFYQSFISQNRQTVKEIGEWRKTASAYKAKPGEYKKLTGNYSNKVYGKISIEAKDNSAEVSFENHPQYKGKLQFLSANTLLIEYNDPVLGVKEIGFDEKAGTIEIKVNEFVDMDTYLFKKM